MINTALFAQRKHLLIESTFQDSVGSMHGWFKGAARQSSIIVSNTVTHNGHKSLRFELNKSDPLIGSSKRAEISMSSQHNKQKLEQWFGWSMYLPKSYIYDVEPEIIAQWHDVADADLGELSRTPPIAINTYKGRYFLQVLWATARVNTNKTVDGVIYPDLGPYETDKWTNWVVHIKFSWQNDGIIEIWKNGAKVYARYGPNSYNDETSPYFKLGLYKWMWAPTEDKGRSLTTQRVMYVSDIRVGDANASYNDVDPSK